MGQPFNQTEVYGGRIDMEVKREYNKGELVALRITGDRVRLAELYRDITGDR